MRQAKLLRDALPLLPPGPGGKHGKWHLFRRQTFKKDLENKSITHSRRSSHCHFIGPNGVDVWNVRYDWLTHHIPFHCIPYIGLNYLWSIWTIALWATAKQNNIRRFTPSQFTAHWRNFLLWVSALCILLESFCTEVCPLWGPTNTCRLSSSYTALQWNPDKMDSPKAFSLALETNTDCIVPTGPEK